MAKIFLYGVQGQYGNYCAALRAAGITTVSSFAEMEAVLTWTSRLSPIPTVKTPLTL